MTFDKVRLRFRKENELRFLSHHDLMRCFERLLRRSGLPYRSSQGFHPLPRISIVQPLALGMIGTREVMELELTHFLPPDEILQRLQRHSPSGLTFSQITPIAPNLSAVPIRHQYQVELRIPSPILAEKVQQLDLQDKIWVERLHPKPKSINVRPFIQNLAITANDLAFSLWITTKGTARADEILSLLQDDLNGADLFGLITRTDLILLDELSNTDRLSLPDLSKEPEQIFHPGEKTPRKHLHRTKETIPTSDPDWGTASPNWPRVE